MIVTLSHRRFSALIRQLENIEDTDAEILENAHVYGIRLGNYLREYGLQIVAVGRDTGEICDWQLQLTSSDRETVVRGLQMLQPVNVTVEQADLPRLILNRVMLGCFQENWYEVQPLLAKIQPGELLNRVEDLAGKIAFGSRSPEKAVETHLGFESWCIQNGLPIPGQAQNRYDEFRQREIEERQRQEKAAHDRQWGEWTPF